MTDPSNPPLKSADTDEVLAQRSNVLWARLIENLAFKYAGRQGEPVVDRLPRNELVKLDLFLDEGVDIDDACILDDTFVVPPLFLAITRPSLPLVNALLDRGASVSMRTVNAASPLNVSMNRSALTLNLIEGALKSVHDQAITRALLSCPAYQSPEEVNASDESLMTPLAICVVRRNVLARDLLMANGANPRCRTADGHTLLHLLSSTLPGLEDGIKEEAAWLQWMIDQGVPVDAVDEDDNTARDLAYERRNPKRNPNDGFLALLDGVLAHHQAAHLERTTASVHIAEIPPPRRI